MTPADLFDLLETAGLASMLEAEFNRRDLCVLTTRIVIDVAEYFGIEAQPLPVRAIAYNAQFAKHIEAGDVENALEANDGSHSIGIGFELSQTPLPSGYWAGHLIVAAGSQAADFSIHQADRPAKGMIFPKALSFALSPATSSWSFHFDDGLTIEYLRINDNSYTDGPDWRDAKRRRAIVGKLIRTLKRLQASRL